MKWKTRVEKRHEPPKRQYTLFKHLQLSTLSGGTLRRERSGTFSGGGGSSMQVKVSEAVRCFPFIEL
jgi:hypothetical protein